PAAKLSHSTLADGQIPPIGFGWFANDGKAGSFSPTTEGLNMKTICTFGVVLILAVTGCSSRRVATMQGQGTRQVFYAPYDQVWRAAVDASQKPPLTVISADRNTGYIATHRTIRPHTFGENVGVWVTSISPNETA